MLFRMYAPNGNVVADTKETSNTNEITEFREAEKSKAESTTEWVRC